jgi:putative ATP-dependent endonuclease of OLD family
MLPHHAVLIGDNNTGKTTLLESLDLALGPDRLNRTPPIDEHDFYEGRYLAKATPDTSTEGEDVSPEGGDAETVEGEPENVTNDSAPRIEIEVKVTDFSISFFGSRKCARRCGKIPWEHCLTILLPPTRLSAFQVFLRASIKP